MKLVMTLLVRDEEEILAANLDFHLAHGVDFFIATDNLSVDRTLEILRSYERRGLLHYIYQPEADYAQSRWVTHMARLARTEFAADWVINNDADEFWWPERGDLKQILGAVPASCDAVAVERTNFLPRPMADGHFFADVMTVRERRSLNTLDNPLPPKVSHRAFPDVTVAMGNHSVSREGQPIPTIAAPIAILHFPVRTYKQFEDKIAKGGAAVRRNGIPELVPTWLRLYELYEAGKLESYFRASMPHDTAIDAGLCEGRYVFDDRLKNFFLTSGARLDEWDNRHA
jgi:glycosyl transferase family 2